MFKSRQRKRKNISIVLSSQTRKIFLRVSDCRKSLFFQKSACSQSLTPNPFPVGRGYITGATAPSPCRGLCPCDPIFDKQEVFRQTETRKIFLRVYFYIVLYSLPLACLERQGVLSKISFQDISGSRQKSLCSPARLYVSPLLCTQLSACPAHS